MIFDPSPLIRCYSRFRLARLERSTPSEMQEQQLKKLLKRAENTRFGREHDFGSISGIPEYQARVKLRTYEDFWNDYWKESFPKLEECTWKGKIPFFCVSSGTTSGKTKYIPYTNEMVRSNSRAGLDLLSTHLLANPKSRLFGGKSFMLGGSTDLKQESPGVWSGDLSGIATMTMPWFIKPFSFPSEEQAFVSDWEEKIDIFAKESLKQDIRLLAGVPSWMLILIERLKKITGKSRLCEIYPNLELLIHGGVKFDPYREVFNELLSGSHAETREVYPASEGFIAFQDQGFDEGLRLLTDHQIFYEFVPLEELESTNPTRHWVGNIEPGVNYAVVMTTAAGLWSYVIGDTVRFIDVVPPRLLVTGRTAYMLSAFGEHLIEEEIEKAVSGAATHIGSQIRDFSVGAVYPESPGELGGHLYFIEFDSVPDTGRLTLFSQKLDQILSELNDDYRAHRSDGFGLRMPEVVAVPEGFFANWMKSRGKLGGQNKVPRVINDRDLFNNLKNAAQS